jgi:hypothetical protein
MEVSIESGSTPKRRRTFGFFLNMMARCRAAGVGVGLAQCGRGPVFYGGGAT